MNLKPVLRTLMFFLSAWICTSFSYAQTLLIKDGKTKVKIILKEDIQVNKVAANLFQFFFQKITSIGLLQGKNNRIKRNKSDIIYYILTI